MLVESSFMSDAVRERSSNGYLLIGASGGLNQQRTGISDAVAVARILNATLVVPELDHNSYWKDDSDFVDIFDVNWFISYLAKDVTIVKRVPDKFMRSMEKPPYTMRVPRKSPPEYYLDQVLPILQRRSSPSLDAILSKLSLGSALVRTSAKWSLRSILKYDFELCEDLFSRSNSSNYRFEPDMLALSGCYFGGGDKERYKLGEIRKRWETLTDVDADGERRRGICPLTPQEVGLMLRHLVLQMNHTSMSHLENIYGGEERLRALRDLFPNFYTKEMLAEEELKPFLPFSSRLAAIDYIVSDESDVFVTNNNGNMAKILAGRRPLGDFVDYKSEDPRSEQGNQGLRERNKEEEPVLGAKEA
ncbi:Matrixin family protein [Hibiscus syriacus]|uniref:O-fucosyltransferase family protein n=1 Tax=Hibiscus syriacus TaxID=106335 RepID=A0A6A2XSZ1_HIBSY|nr:Matrixin family protein [Hibiscus syriacus]